MNAARFLNCLHVGAAQFDLVNRAEDVDGTTERSLIIARRPDAFARCALAMKLRKFTAFADQRAAVSKAVTLSVRRPRRGLPSGSNGWEFSMRSGTLSIFTPYRYHGGTAPRGGLPRTPRAGDAGASKPTFTRFTPSGYSVELPPNNTRKRNAPSALGRLRQRRISLFRRPHRAGRQRTVTGMIAKRTSQLYQQRKCRRR